MSTEQPSIDDLLGPISEEQPCGVDLRWVSSEWGPIEEARRSDPAIESGVPQEKESKSADWRLVEELTFEALQTKTKDLRLAIRFAEASLKLHGSSGLAQGFRLLRELMARFWDKGLFPLMDEGPEDRARQLEWLSDKLGESVLDLPITRRSDKGGDDLSMAQLRAAKGVGSESSFKDKDGEIDEAKKKKYTEALAAAGVSMDMYIAAQTFTQTEDNEALAAEIADLQTEFKALDKVADEKFGENAAPNLSNLRGILREINQEVGARLEQRRKSLQSAGGSLAATESNGIAGLSPLASLGDSSNGNGSWQEAEQLVRSGKVNAGLSAMTRLAASETTGRNRFQRKLLLAEVCLSSRRNDLARAILEELAEQIDKFKLSEWESSDLVGGVWSRLYKIYKQDSGDKERAKELFEQLCRLDPWQALSCGD